jgi:hypothetical protein
MPCSSKLKLAQYMMLVSVFLSTSNLSVHPAKGQIEYWQKYSSAATQWKIAWRGNLVSISRAKMARIYVATHCCSGVLRVIEE